jgi:hypothetical protein
VTRGPRQEAARSFVVVGRWLGRRAGSGGLGFGWTAARGRHAVFSGGLGGGGQPFPRTGVGSAASGAYAAPRQRHELDQEVPGRLDQLGRDHLPTETPASVCAASQPPVEIRFRRDPECRRESERQPNRTRDEERARRLGEHPEPFRPPRSRRLPEPSTPWHRRPSGTVRTATSPSRSSPCSPPRKPPAPPSPTASPTSPRSDASSEFRLTVTDHRARRPDGRRARNSQLSERSWSSSLPIASRSTSCCGPSLNRSSLHRSRG